MRVAGTVLRRAAPTSGGGFPEVIGGFSSEEFPEPVRYRLAGVPQAWSAAAGVAAVRLIRNFDPKALTADLKRRTESINPKTMSSETGSVRLGHGVSIDPNNPRRPVRRQHP